MIIIQRNKRYVNTDTISGSSYLEGRKNVKQNMEFGVYNVLGQVDSNRKTEKFSEVRVLVFLTEPCDATNGFWKKIL